MKIAVDARELEGRPTGVGRYLANLLRWWARSAGDDRFILLHHREPVVELPDCAQIERRSIDGTFAASGLYWQQAALVRALRKIAPDVVFGPAGTLPLRWNGPAVSTVHDLSFFARPEWFGRVDGIRRRWLARRSARRAGRIVAVSRFTRDEIRRYLPEAAARVEVVLHGVDDTLVRLAPTPEPALRERLRFDGPFALAVGSLFERRVPLRLIRAFRHLQDLDMGLVIVGDDRRLNRGDDIRSEITRLGLSDRISWLSYCSEADLVGLYRTAHHLVYLSEYEGFGLPPLEAMSFGLPVIVSGADALVEIYASSALVLEGHDEIAIAAAVRRMAGSDGTREELSRQGRELAGRLRLEDCAARTLDLIRATGGD